MGKLVIWNIATLDGYFEGPSAWDLCFHDRIWDDDLSAFSVEQQASASALLFGRKTYEGMAAYWSNETDETAAFMNSARKYVVSQSLDAANWKNTTLVKGDAAEAVDRLKAETLGDILVFGSADLCTFLLLHRLVDEYRTCIAPILLGSGTRLFPDGGAAEDLTLMESRELSSGTILARYAFAARGR